MKRFALGLTGFPLEHSLSPRLHRAALRAAGLAGDYVLYPIPPLPGGAAQLDELLARLRRGELHGLNVTIPHKRAVMPYLDDLTPAAQAVGAVNTIYAQDGHLVGENTDAPGLLADLQVFWQIAYSHEMPGGETSGHALMLGAGGAARAAAYALLSAGWRVTLAARRVEQAAQVAVDLRPATADPLGLRALELSAAGLAERLPQIDLLVNATPVGMWPEVQVSPWPAGLALPARAAVYDLVYNPAETVLLVAARRAGLPAANGLGMLVEQAALAFERWTGAPADRRAMRQSLAGFLKGSEP